MAIDSPDYQQLSQLAAPEFLGAVSIAVGQTVGQVAVTLSPFATAIAVVPVSAAGLSALDAVGFGSGIAYILVNGPNNIGAGYVAPVFGNTDNPITVQCQIPIANPGPGAILAANVYQLFGAGAVQVTAQGQQPLLVRPYGGDGNIQASTLMKMVHVANNLAAGGAAIFVAAVANVQLVVYGYQLSATPVGAVAGGYQAQFEDTGAVNIFAALRTVYATGVGSGADPTSLWIPSGLLMAPGAGLKVVANAGNVGNVFVEGVVYYSPAVGGV